MLFLAVSLLIGAGFLCGGAFTGILLALFLGPIIHAAKTSGDYLKTFKAVVTYLVFGGGFVGTGIITLLGLTDPGGTWACFLIGLLTGLLVGLAYTRGTSADPRDAFRATPPDDQKTLCEGLDKIHDPEDPQFAERFEQSIESLRRRLRKDGGGQQ